jgi:type III secretory pathway component EscS
MSSVYEYHEDNLKRLSHYEFLRDDLSKTICFYTIGVGSASVVGLIHTLFEEIQSLEEKVAEYHAKVLVEEK